MKIRLQVTGFKNHEELEELYRPVLEEKYGVYKFINSINLKIRQGSNNKSEVSLEMNTTNGADLFATATENSSSQAFNSAVNKIKSQVEKYRVKHYHK